MLELLKQNAVKLRKLLLETGGALRIHELEKQAAELAAKQRQDGFWNDIEAAGKVGKALAATEQKINRYNSLKTRVEDVLLLIEMQDEVSLIEAELTALQSETEALTLETLFTGKYDANNAICQLHSGAGGTESCDWVSMLFRMYTRYIERAGYKYTVLDSLAGDEAGIKSITFLVEGSNAYGYLKAEKGVHRLVRISPFDSNSRRHTSFASLEVMPEIEEIKDIKIAPDDLKIDTYRSGGAGGQHVNKTESAVRITHLPSGIVVQCQNERSQIQNRDRAMKMLVSKLIEKQEREQLEKEQSIKGDLKKIEWGSQIRSYVFCPYTMVKDHRTGYETGNVDAVMDGDIHAFIVEYLKRA